MSLLALDLKVEGDFWKLATILLDEYIDTFPADVRSVLKKIRQIIQKAAPGATEAIAYQMPTFTLSGNLVHFAVYCHHTGFYPTPSAIEAFKEEFSPYKGSKGAVQFPLDKPIPFKLIKKWLLSGL